MFWRDERKPATACVVIGGGAVGIETAEVLATSARKVTVVEMLDTVGSDISPTVLPGVLHALEESGVEILTLHVLKEIREGEVVLEVQDGSEKILAAETVVLAVGAVPEDTIVGQLNAAGIPLSVVGDCCGEPPGSIEKSTRGGFFAAFALGDAEHSAPSAKRQHRIRS